MSKCIPTLYIEELKATLRGRFAWIGAAIALLAVGGQATVGTQDNTWLDGYGIVAYGLLPLGFIPVAAGMITSPRITRFVECVFTAPVKRRDWLAGKFLLLMTLAVAYYFAFVPMMLVYIWHVDLPPLLHKFLIWAPDLLIASSAVGTLIGVLFIGRSLASPTGAGLGILLAFAGPMPLQELTPERQPFGSGRKLVAVTDSLRQRSPCRVLHRLLPLYLIVSIFSGPLSAQVAAPQPGPTSNARTIAMTVDNGTPLQIALDKEVRVRKAGEPITGRVMQPVYVFDHLVIPVGTLASGRISAIARVTGRTRALHALDEDFTPAHKLTVAFDELILPGGRHISLHATVVPGSGQVIRLVSADQQKKNAIKDAAAQKMDQVRAQWNDAMKHIESPGRMHLVTRYVVAQLPVHPQYIEAGTLYSAELSEPLDFGNEPVSTENLSSIGTQPPPGSLVHAILLTSLDSATTAKSAEVDAEMSQPLVDQGRLILPAGTHLRGTVLQVRPARSLHRNGQLRIVFREVILPDGAVQPVDSRLQGIQSGAADNAQLDSEGGAKASDSKTRFISTGASVGLALIGSGGRNDVGAAGPTAGGATGFKLVGLIAGITFRSHTYGILMSAYGGGRSIYNNFLGKGRQIVFPKDTVMEIGFGNRTTLPMPAANSGEQR